MPEMGVGAGSRMEPAAGSRRSLILFLLLGIAVGVLHAAPNLWYPVALGRDFRGLPLWNSQDELDRLAAVRAVRDGDYQLKNLYLAEEAAPDKPPSVNSVQIVPYLVSAWLLRAVGDSPQRFAVASKIIFPGVLFVLLAWWTAAMTKSMWLGAATGAAAVLLPTLWSFDFVVFDPGAWWASHLIFMRPGTNLAAVIWVGALFAWERDLTAEKSHWPVTAALLSLVVYSYFFYWSFTLLLLFVFAAFAWISGEQEWARRTALALLGCFLLSSYAWVQIARAAKAALWTNRDFGGAWSHVPISSFFQVFLVGLVFLGWRARRCGLLGRREFLLVMAVGIAHVVAMNQQILTRVILEAHHYEWFVSPVLLTVLLAVLLYRIGSARAGWQLLREDLRRLVGRAPVAAGILGALVLVVLVLGVAGPVLPRPSGGLIGRLARGGWAADKRLLTAAGLVGVLVLAASVRRPRRGAMAALLLAFGAAALMQVASYRATSPWQAPVQEIMPAIRWLNAHTPSRSVVLATPLVSDYLVAHSHDAVYFSDYAMQSPPNVFHDRALRLLAFLGVSGQALAAALDARSAAFDPTVKFCLFYWREFSPEPRVFLDRGRFLRAYSHGDIEREVRRLEAIEHSGSQSVLGPYRCDYVMEWRDERLVHPTSWQLYFHQDLGRIDNLSKVYDDGDVRIFAVARGSAEGHSKDGG